MVPVKFMCQSALTHDPYRPIVYSADGYPFQRYRYSVSFIGKYCKLHAIYSSTVTAMTHVHVKWRNLFSVTRN